MERFQEINMLKERLDSYRPIPEEKQKASMDKFRVEWTYHSNALEGSTMTLSETSFFIQEGLTSKGKPLSDYIKVIGHIRALKSIDAAIEKGDTFSERLIKDVHTSLFSDNIAVGESESRIVQGSYRCENIHTILPDGNIHYFTSYSRIPEELCNLIAWYMNNKDALHPVELAARVHHGLLAIHPFADGNGRVSRLIMNMILMQKGYTPAIIRIEDKAEYLEALYRADRGDCDMLISIVEGEVIKAMTQLLNLIEGKEVFGKKDLKKRLDSFTAKVNALDIETNKFSKDLETERNECIKELYSILYNQMKCLIEKQNELEVNDSRLQTQDSRLSFALSGPVKIQDVLGKGFIYHALNDRNIIPLYDVVEDLLISSRYFVDYISEKGSSMLLEIVPGKDYIPSSFLSFNIIPIRHTVSIVYTIMISRMEDDGEILYCKRTDLIQGSYRYNDWKTNEVEEFLIKGFNEFLNEIEKEIEIRRIQMEKTK
ncbi:MAG TPA: Fic family protein [Candidatus Brocadiales bacterium]|nr:Fic family protein [Candidatus Brocadiales bacterium]